MRQIIESQQPPIALVIATFAGVPYVHLALELWRRNSPHVPVLVHDDGSPRSDELHALCRRYGAEFFCNPTRLRRTVGDLSAYLHGMNWAATLGADLLVKMSRRFIALRNWAPELQRLAWLTQYATYSQRCRHFDFGFRTECIAFHLPSWREGSAFAELRERVEANEPVFVEGYLHNLARRIHQSACDLNLQYEQTHPRPPEANGYGVWQLMPDRRTTKTQDALWHDSDTPVDYARAALLCGLTYLPHDFQDPNQGFGLGEP